MASYNKVIFMGNVVRNPELRYTPGSNLPVARTGLAVNSYRKDKDEVMFIDIVVFGKSAETLNSYAVKGTPLLVDGRLSQRSWEDPNGGGKRYKYEVIVDNFQLLRGSKEQAGEGAAAGTDNSGRAMPESNSNRDSFSSEPTDDEDIPF